MNGRLFARYIVRETMGMVCMAVALFWSAGLIDWWAAWATLGVMLSWITAMSIVIMRLNPDMLKERLGPRKGAKLWDTVVMSVLGVTQLGRYVVAGLDHRYGWTGGFPLTVQILSLLPCVLGYTLFVWAVAKNAFFSQIVRIQSERGHAVVTNGPYQYVRHPSYAGSILFELAVSILLSSWWAFVASIFAVSLLILRTALEDRTLQNELNGYSEYSRRVRYRLIPGIW
jgi:protein-S-isoprenylcysteine O-methyltransferase Ste14